MSESKEAVDKSVHWFSALEEGEQGSGGTQKCRIFACLPKRMYGVTTERGSVTIFFLSFLCFATQESDRHSLQSYQQKLRS